jgi:hypothetical protein
MPVLKSRTCTHHLDRYLAAPSRPDLSIGADAPGLNFGTLRLPEFL